MSEAFPTAPTVVEDVQLLHRHGLVTLRLVEPEESDGEALHRIEAAHGGYRTSALHVREPVAGPG